MLGWPFYSISQPHSHIHTHSSVDGCIKIENVKSLAPFCKRCSKASSKIRGMSPHDWWSMWCFILRAGKSLEGTASKHESIMCVIAMVLWRLLFCHHTVSVSSHKLSQSSFRSLIVSYSLSRIPPLLFYSKDFHSCHCLLVAKKNKNKIANADLHLCTSNLGGLFSHWSSFKFQGT